MSASRRAVPGIVLLALVGVGAAGCPAPKNATAPGKSVAAPALLVEAVTVGERRSRQENLLSGQGEPYDIATISTEVGARLVRRPVDQGDRVARGELLAALDDSLARASLAQSRAAYDQAVAARRQLESDYRRAVVQTDAARQQAGAQLDQARESEKRIRSLTRSQEQRQAEAALSQAQTDERLARVEADRYKNLVADGAAAQQLLDRANATLEAAVARRQSSEEAVSLLKEGARSEDIAAAVAQVSSARANLRIADTRNTQLATLRRQIEGLRAQEAQTAAGVRQARIQLDKHRIFAPFDGRILAKLAEPGEMLAAGTPIVRLGQIRRVKVTFAVPESSRSALRPGQPVTVSADAVKGKTFAGRIATLGFQADARARTFPIEVMVGNPGEVLLPNMVARLRLPVGPSAARTLVPVAAVATDGETSFVYVLKENRAARREVVLGIPSGDQVEVLRGLTPGETIAATPQRLTDGAQVRVSDASSAAR